MPGPQTLAFNSKAQFLGYGGAAGGGKTDLLFGKAYYHHHRAIIFRREYTQFQPIIDRGQEIFGVDGERGAFYSGKSPQTWRFPTNLPPGKRISLGAVATQGSEQKFQGHPHDLKGFDELPHFGEVQFNYLRGWLRSTSVPQDLWQVIATMNPPRRAQERWFIPYWAPWLDRKSKVRAMPGDILWYIIHDRQHIIVDGPGKHKYKNQTHGAMSRTFIFSSVRDNMYLEGTPYEDVLDSLPEPFRSQLLFGDFEAGMDDAPDQLIPTEWIVAAQARWRERKEPTHWPVTQIGFDVSRGGKDRTVVTPRRGPYICSQIEHPGKVIKDGKKAAQVVMPHKADKTLIVVDVVGVGTSAFDFLKDLHNPELVIPFNGAEASQKTDRSGFLGFINQRSAGYWHLRELLDPNIPRPPQEELCLPDDSELLAELASITWTPSLHGVKVHSKEDIMKNAETDVSPDKADSLMYSVAEPEIPGRGILQFYAEQAQQQREKLAEEREQGTAKRKTIIIGPSSKVQADPWWKKPQDE